MRKLLFHCFPRAQLIACEVLCRCSSGGTPLQLPSVDADSTVTETADTGIGSQINGAQQEMDGMNPIPQVHQTAVILSDRPIPVLAYSFHEAYIRPRRIKVTKHRSLQVPKRRDMTNLESSLFALTSPVSFSLQSHSQEITSPLDVYPPVSYHNPDLLGGNSWQ